MNADEVARQVVAKRIENQVENFKNCQKNIMHAMRNGHSQTPCHRFILDVDLNKLRMQGFNIIKEKGGSFMYVSWSHKIPSEQSIPRSSREWK